MTSENPALHHTRSFHDLVPVATLPQSNLHPKSYQASPVRCGTPHCCQPYPAQQHFQGQLCPNHQKKMFKQHQMTGEKPKKKKLVKTGGDLVKIAKKRLLDEDSMTEGDKKRIQKLKGINKEQEALYQSFKAAFSNQEREKLTECAQKFILLQIQKNEEEKQIPDAQALADAVVKRVNEMKDTVVRGWLISYSSFCLFMEEHYLKVRAHKLMQQ